MELLQLKELLLESVEKNKRLELELNEIKEKNNYVNSTFFIHLYRFKKVLNEFIIRNKLDLWCKKSFFFAF